MMADIQNKLQEIREEKRFSRPQLAEIAEVSWETIKAYEVKGALPSLPVALRIARALETPLEAIFSLEQQAQMNQQELN